MTTRQDAEDNLAHYCEICGYTLPEDPIEPCSCESRQDSSFWVNESGWEEVWSRYGEVAYKVIRNGEMKVHYTDPKGYEHTIRYTSDLDRLGIDTDKKLYEMGSLGDDVWFWDNNSWFEVWDAGDGSIEVDEFLSDAIHTLDEAVAYALELDKERRERTTK